MKRENTQLIKAIIEEFIKEERLEEGLNRTRLFKAWDLVVGEVGARATTNKYFKDGVLYCTINSSMLRTQMYYRKEDIISHMNKMLNGPIVTKLILK
jgi:aromatic ring hydroxylase